MSSHFASVVQQLDESDNEKGRENFSFFSPDFLNDKHIFTIIKAGVLGPVYLG